MGWSLRPALNLSGRQFQQWSQLLEMRTGMLLKPSQKSMLQAQLAMRMREINCEDVDQYFKSVQKEVVGAQEWSVLVSRISVNETRFFRHQESFEWVKSYVDRLLVQLPADVSLWSVGCATGEEPYSLAMLVDECLERAASVAQMRVVASDISAEAIKTARAGEYSINTATQIGPHLLEKYFESHSGKYRVCEKLRERVSFSDANVLNLGGEIDDSEKFDVVFCQNMLIYFQDWRKENVLNALANYVKPGGILIVGLGETRSWRNPLLTPCKDQHVQVYTRTPTE